MEQSVSLSPTCVWVPKGPAPGGVHSLLGVTALTANGQGLVLCPVHSRHPVSLGLSFFPLVLSGPQSPQPEDGQEGGVGFAPCSSLHPHRYSLLPELWPLAWSSLVSLLAARRPRRLGAAVSVSRLKRGHLAPLPDGALDKGVLP